MRDLDTVPGPKSFGIFDRTDELATAHHEMVAFCHDVETGLRAIISVHDTTLGPALGGTRFFPYQSEREALADGLRLAQGMTFKAAAAGMPLGGGKAVIVGDPSTQKTPELLRAYGRFINRLSGTYITAADVGTTSDDLDIIGQTTQYVVGRSSAVGGSGDSGYSTAFGVYCAMRAAAETLWGDDGLRGRRVGIEGAGKVGFHLAALLAREDIEVLVADPDQAALDRVLDVHREVQIVSDVATQPVDVYAPCALGATLNPISIPAFHATLICGAANNQLLTASDGELLHHRGIHWVPDYVANAGGLIQVGGELQGRTGDDVLHDVERIGRTVKEIFEESRQTGRSTGKAASDIVNARLAAARAREAS